MNLYTDDKNFKSVIDRDIRIAEENVRRLQQENSKLIDGDVNNSVSNYIDSLPSGEANRCSAQLSTDYRNNMGEYYKRLKELKEKYGYYYKK